MRIRIALLVVAVAACCLPANAPAAQYQVRRLPGWLRATGLNDWGTVVAVSGTDSYVWKRHSVTLIPPLDGRSMQAIAINNNGMVAGSAYTSQGDPRPFAWTRLDGVRDLGGPGDGCYGYPIALQPAALNDGGMVVGTLEDADCDRRAVWWDGHGMHYVPTYYGWANDVNSIGQVVGLEIVGDSPYNYAWYGFVWRAGRSPRLLRFHNSDTMATGINDKGTVVGFDGPGWWVLVPGHSVRAIPATGLLITNHQIIGLSSDGFATWNLRGRNRQLIRLRHGWQIDSIVDANNRGQLIGTAHRPGEDTVSVLIRPTQRPS